MKTINICECLRGDVIDINGTNLVVVDEYTKDHDDSSIGYIFTANIGAYIAVESGNGVTYSPSNSGYEKFNKDTTVTRLGHITIYGD